MLLWSNVPELGNLASSTLPVIAVGCALLFIRNVFSLFVHYHRFDRFLSSVGWGTIASVLAFAVMDRFVADRVCGMIMLFATVVGLIAVFLSWRGGSMVARWLMLALAPQFLGLIYMVGEAIGMLPVLWEVRYWASLGIALTVPIMLYALSHITHDRKELVVRANHLPTQDALTGLLTAEVFKPIWKRLCCAPLKTASRWPWLWCGLSTTTRSEKSLATPRVNNVCCVP